MARLAMGPVLLVSFFMCSLASNELGLELLNATRYHKGVIRLKSGLQYKVLTNGTGKYHPDGDAACRVHYSGTTPSMTRRALHIKDEKQWETFESTHKTGNPQIFRPNNLVPGMKQALKMMVEGDKWELYVPTHLGYNWQGMGAKIDPGDALIFRVELVSIKEGEKKHEVPCNFQTHTWCEDHEVEVLEVWYKKPIAEVEAEIKRLTDRKKEVLKKGEQDANKKTLKVLKRIVKESLPSANTVLKEEL